MKNEANVFGILFLLLITTVLTFIYFYTKTIKSKTMYQHNEMTGSMFPNEKQKDAQPCYTGTCLIEGKKYKIAAWTKHGKTQFYSMKFQPFEEKIRPAGQPEIKKDFEKPKQEEDFSLPF